LGNLPHICKLNVKTMVDRIRLLLQAKQLTPTQFADTIGLARPIISHILSGRNKPSLEVVQKILGAFPDLSMAWLLNGAEPMWAPVVAPVMLVAPLATAAPPRENLPAENAATTPMNMAASQPRGRRVAVAPLASATAHNATARPQRFQAAKQGAATPAPVAAPVAEQEVVLPTQVELPEQAVPTAPVPASPVDPAAALFAMPGKAIRRIVIFYQDGSFADYQPE
jgi:transcriptional regulator with XRE-family HTH domain